MDTKKITQPETQTTPDTDTIKSATSVPKKRKIVTIREGINKLPDKKPHLDFLAGILTIPLLIVSLILGWNNLTGKNAAKTSPTPSPAPTIIYKTVGGNVTPLAVTTKPTTTIDQNQCVKDIGPLSISYPQEGQTISDNPVCIGIDYQAGNYCAVVWAYQINGGPLSDYGNNSVCLSNLSSGNYSFVLHVKSLASTSIQTLTRNFIYKNTNTSPTSTGNPTTTPTVSATPTATQ